MVPSVLVYRASSHILYIYDDMETEPSEIIMITDSEGNDVGASSMQAALWNMVNYIIQKDRINAYKLPYRTGRETLKFYCTTAWHTKQQRTMIVLFKRTHIPD